MSDDPADTGAAPAAGAPARPAAPLLAWLPWIAAVAFALLLGLAGQAYFSARSETAALRAQAALAEIECQSLRQQIEAERILAARRLEQRPAGVDSADEPEQLQVIPLYADADPNAPVRAVVLWDAIGQQGELAAFLMPALPSGQNYRVCIFDPQSTDPVTAGVFAVPPAAGDTRVHLRPARPVANAARFTVTAGSLGSEPRSSDPIILRSR